MDPASIVDRLASYPIFQGVPRHELAWLVEHSQLRTLQEDSKGTTLGGDINEMMVLLAGRAGLHQQRGNALRKVMEVVEGAVVGALPYSRFHKAPGVVIIEKAITALVLSRDLFPEMIHDHTELTTVLVHYMLDRSREFRTVQLNDERLESLSRLAAGFAHELNNPASAATRTAQSLVELLNEEERSARELAGARLSDAQLAAVDALRKDCGKAGRTRTALEAADREDDFAEWLTRHGLSPALAETLAASDASMAALEDLARALPREAMCTAIRWIASGCAARVASQQIESATTRIHDLVGAVKGFTFMDRQGVPEDVDIAKGLADTLALLDRKARTKSARVHLETAEDLPRLSGFGGEINQVWEKIVDNAIDAVGDRGHVTITATTRGDAIVVRVADDGPGIPEEIQTRVFDPFFTTKPVGKGAGVGLDMARRIVHNHGGDISFTTQPGRTVFKVSLPISGARGIRA